MMVSPSGWTLSPRGPTFGVGLVAVQWSCPGTNTSPCAAPQVLLWSWVKEEQDPWALTGGVGAPRVWQSDHGPPSEQVGREESLAVEHKVWEGCQGVLAPERP